MLSDSPNLSSLLYCIMRVNIWGRNAAMVSPVSPGGRCAAINKPSCMVMTAPATPFSAAVRWAISAGAQFFRPG